MEVKLWPLIGAAVGFIIGNTVSLWNAEYQSTALNDLVVQRNLAFLSERFVVQAMSTEASSSINQPDEEFKTAQLAIDSVQYGGIRPSILLADFVDIAHMEHQAKELYLGTDATKKAETKGRARVAMDRIDQCLNATRRVSFMAESSGSVEWGSAYMDDNFLSKVWDAAKSLAGMGWEYRCVTALKQ